MDSGLGAFAVLGQAPSRGQVGSWSPLGGQNFQERHRSRNFQRLQCPQAHDGCSSSVQGGSREVGVRKLGLKGGTGVRQAGCVCVGGCECACARVRVWQGYPGSPGDEAGEASSLGRRTVPGTKLWGQPQQAVAGS